jgi:enoyl-CoA hydratase/carnithine racemase
VLPGTSFGLPELQLGIIPGFGGTQRLPRTVGLQKAVEMMLTSTPIKDRAALKLGLVDEVVPAAQLLEAAKQMALDIAGAGIWCTWCAGLDPISGLGGTAWRSCCIRQKCSALSSRTAWCNVITNGMLLLVQLASVHGCRPCIVLTSWRHWARRYPSCISHESR